MTKLEKTILDIKALGAELIEKELLSRRSSFKIGGPVGALVLPETVEQLRAVCAAAAENGLRPMLLGNGTNVLFPDEGLQDLLMIGTEKLCAMRLEEDGGIYAEAGVSLAKLAIFAQQNGLTGLEFAGGIPGSLGGGTLMNAGAYGGELKDVIAEVTALELDTLRLITLKNADCAFRYRGSVFKEKNCAIVAARLCPEKGDMDAIAAKMRELARRRREKQPLDLPSAGSAFKRPEGYYAAALIDECGLKGYSVGGAQVSEKHAGFVVNTGGASAADVRQLMADVRRIVLEKKGVELEPEMIMLPADFQP